MKKKFLLAMATMAAMFCLFATSAFASGTLQTNHDVYMRTGPDTSYSVMYTLPAGTSVAYDHTENGWACVVYNGDTGFIYSDYLGSYSYSAPAAAAPTPSYGGYTITGDVNMRTGPSTDYASIAVLPAGAKVTVGSTSNGWAYVYYGNYAGYVSTRYISGLGGGTSTSSAVANSTGTTWYNGYNYANVYDYRYYLANNRDLAPVIGTNPNDVIAHFVNFGMSEGRQAISSFNVYTYRDQHPDLRNLYGDDLARYYMYACGVPWL